MQCISSRFQGFQNVAFRELVAWLHSNTHPEPPMTCFFQMSQLLYHRADLRYVTTSLPLHPISSPPMTHESSDISCWVPAVLLSIYFLSLWDAFKSHSGWPRSARGLLSVVSWAANALRGLLLYSHRGSWATRTSPSHTRVC